MKPFTRRGLMPETSIILVLIVAFVVLSYFLITGKIPWLSHQILSTVNKTTDAVSDTFDFFTGADKQRAFAERQKIFLNKFTAFFAAYRQCLQSPQTHCLCDLGADAFRFSDEFFISLEWLNNKLYFVPYYKGEEDLAVPLDKALTLVGKPCVYYIDRYAYYTQLTVGQSEKSGAHVVGSGELLYPGAEAPVSGVEVDHHVPSFLSKLTPQKGEETAPVCFSAGRETPEGVTLLDYPFGGVHVKPCSSVTQIP